MAYGYLITRVYTSRAQLPVAGASVLVTRSAPEGQTGLLGIRITDENGETAPIRIETPAAGESTAPPDSPDLPWTACDIAAEAPGFNREVVRDVQIFPGVTSVQTLSLVPQAEIPDTWSGTWENTVIPQSLS